VRPATATITKLPKNSYHADAMDLQRFSILMKDGQGKLMTPSDASFWVKETANLEEMRTTKAFAAYRSVGIFSLEFMANPRIWKETCGFDFNESEDIRAMNYNSLPALKSAPYGSLPEFATLISNRRAILATYLAEPVLKALDKVDLEVNSIFLQSGSLSNLSNPGLQRALAVGVKYAQVRMNGWIRSAVSDATNGMHGSRSTDMFDSHRDIGMQKALQQLTMITIGDTQYRKSPAPAKSPSDKSAGPKKMPLEVKRGLTIGDERLCIQAYRPDGCRRKALGTCNMAHPAIKPVLEPCVKQWALDTYNIRIP